VRCAHIITSVVALSLLAACTDPPPAGSDAVTDSDVPAAAEVLDGEEEEHWDSGPVPGTDGPLTFDGVIRPILYYYCTPCHLGEDPRKCDGFSCFVDFYDALFFPAYTSPECGDMLKWECGMVRIYKTLPNSGSPDGLLDANNDPIVVQPDHLKLLEAWIEAGLPKS